MLLPTGVQIQKSGTNLLNLTFTYNPVGSNNGNIVNQTIASATGLAQSLTQAYSYDPENRLISLAETPGGSINQGFVFDAFGNMALTSGVLNTQPGHTPTASSYRSLPFNSLNQWTTPCNVPPCYDAAGNQTGVAGDVYSYDGENRMTVANPAAEGDTSYGYDGVGQRVWKANALGATVYAYDAAGKLVAEYSTVAPQSSGTEYLSTDHLGSTRMITDANRNQVSRYDYVPFGQEIPSGTDGRGSGYGTSVYPSAPDVQDQKFTGKERDAESGLDYFGARYYGSNTGRWMSPDWNKAPTGVPYADLTNPQTLNLYQYMRNNPLSGADPDGHCDWCQKLWNGITGKGFVTNGQFGVSTQQGDAYVTQASNADTAVAAIQASEEPIRRPFRRLSFITQAQPEHKPSSEWQTAKSAR
jgi:RHS repeat-associated protein